MLAEATNTPQLELEPKEAKQLGDAVVNVAAQYNHVINPKTAAWVQLCVACGAIYGTRIAAIRMDAKVKRSKSKLHTMPKTEAEPAPTMTTPEPTQRTAEL